MSISFDTPCFAEEATVYFYFTTNLGVTMTLTVIAVFAIYFIGKSAIEFHYAKKLNGLWAASIAIIAIGALTQVFAMDAVIDEARFIASQAEMFGDEIVASSYQMSSFVPLMLLTIPYAIGIPMFLTTSILKRRQRVAHEKRAMTSAQAVHDVRR